MTLFLASFECICVHIQSCVLLPLSYSKSHIHGIVEVFMCFFSLFRSLFTLNYPLLFAEWEYSCKMPRYVFFWLYASTYAKCQQFSTGPCSATQTFPQLVRVCLQDRDRKRTSTKYIPTIIAQSHNSLGDLSALAFLCSVEFLALCSTDTLHA